jgi:hypothetical protein
MIPRCLVGMLVRRRWRTFCGCSHDELVVRAEAALSELGLSCWIAKSTPTGAERSVFGAEQATRIRIEEMGFAVTVTSVTDDFLLRTALRIISSEATLSKRTGRLAIIDVRPIEPSERREVASFITALVARMEHPPWKIQHPRFRLAFLLRYKVRLLWKYWLPADREHETPPRHDPILPRPSSNPSR